MKYIYYLFSLSLISCGAPLNEPIDNKNVATMDDTLKTENKENLPVNKDDFAFELVINRSEHSKDSNRQQSIYSLSGNRLTKTYQASGRRAKPKESKFVDLSVEQIETLKALLLELNLTEAYQKSYPVADEGMILSYKANFKTAAYQISVEGGEEQQNDVQARQLQRFAAKLDVLLD
jgi:hypothetical protein